MYLSVILMEGLLCLLTSVFFFFFFFFENNALKWWVLSHFYQYYVYYSFYICFMAGLAWIIIPQSIHLTASGFTYDSWRLFLAICTLPSATSAVLYVIMPESPKYLYQVECYLYELISSQGTDITTFGSISLRLNTATVVCIKCIHCNYVKKIKYGSVLTMVL